MIVRDGLRRMCTEQEDVFYYLTVMNENYAHPPLPEGAEEGILKGMYLLREAPAGDGPKVQLLGSGAILREVDGRGRAARERLRGRRRRLERDELHRAAAGRDGGRALEPAPSDGAAAASVRRGMPRGAGRARPSRPPTTCGRSPTRSGRSSPAATRCSAPTASAAATTGSSCGSSSRSTATTSPSRRSRRSPTRATIEPSVVAGRDRALRDRRRVDAALEALTSR